MKYLKQLALLQSVEVRMLCGEASKFALGALWRELPGAPGPAAVAGPLLALRGCRAGPGQPGAKPEEKHRKELI